MEAQPAHSTPGTHPVTAAGTHQGPPLIPSPQTDTVTCRSGAPGQPRGSRPRPPCPQGRPAQGIGQAQDHPSLTRPAAQCPPEDGAWISGIHTIPHASFNQGTECACKDTGKRGHLPRAHAQPGTEPRPCTQVLSQLQERKPHGAPVITASGHSPGALLLPQGSGRLPVRGSLPIPSDCSGLTWPPYPGRGAPSLAQLTLVTRRRLSTPAGPARGETNQVSDSKRHEGAEQPGAGSRDGEPRQNREGYTDSGGRR